jgi:hypothetical protein
MGTESLPALAVILSMTISFWPGQGKANVVPRCGGMAMPVYKWMGQVVLRPKKPCPLAEEAAWHRRYLTTCRECHEISRFNWISQPTASQ